MFFRPWIDPAVLLSLFFLLCLTASGCSALLLLKNRWLKRQLARQEQSEKSCADKLSSALIREAELSARLQSERQHGHEKLQLLEDAREELKLQFEHLAAQIFEDKSTRFSELNQTKLDAILGPFNTQLGRLKSEINEMYLSETRDRTSLKQEILQLKELNVTMAREAENLTRALTSDNKSQGNWGEMILENILEKSGLRKGHEYRTQGAFRDADNKLFKPDIIVHLPGDKDIVIDSKVSLLSWERFVSCDDQDLKTHHLKQLSGSIRTHVNQLSEKSYQLLRGINSLDFVLMFLPIEAAFSTVVRDDDTLVTDALNKNIIIVTPTTLLATLRTVGNIWHFEHQSRNSQEIARRAGLMYDKFRGFMEDMEKIGKQLAMVHSSHEAAFDKLTRGRGNLVSQASQLKSLGVQTKKDLPRSITEVAEINGDDGDDR
ncbi:DNA recombination protein RmuC [Desulforhopalus singaporensis]|uniref:DNA recombination protein RmuC n=2 Tax=Desulforhopalus singaporensis TaxID=91360 RepID=A0A1H0Q763_9BACT|nr:DNA recombination protein RmuC [Desulforhopalus singaporensis]